MPTLQWIGKEAVVEHHKEVPFHLLRCNPGLSVGDPGSGNLLIQGDNLLALKALLPYYAGKVKCIYIDPPYNTGNEKWIYNDNVNSPEIKAWLGQVVGGEAEDLSRDDKWLCMMYPRLVLLRELLHIQGSLWMSIDDNQAHQARIILDEVFGKRNFVVSLTWQKRVSPANDAKYFSSDHEYILVYARSKEIWRPNKLQRTTKQLKNYTNPDNDLRGPWNSATYTGPKSIEERPNLYYGIENPNTGEVIFPKKTAVWKFDREAHLKHIQENRIYWGVSGNNKMPRLKIFLDEMGKVTPRSILMYDEHGHTAEARTEILRLISDVPFTTPKPIRLIKRILQIASNPNDLVLDSFAGSGTSGHAVLSLNQEENGNRRFILVEMESNIAQNITAQRLKKAIEGYSWLGQGNKVIQIQGLEGSFRFCELDTPLFDSAGQIRQTVTFSDLAHHIFFTETGEPLPGPLTEESPMIGKVQETAVYLLYNGVMGDKRPEGGNLLTRQTLATLPPHAGPKVIYGEGCLLSKEYLQANGITFRQVPYEVRVT